MAEASNRKAATEAAVLEVLAVDSDQEAATTRTADTVVAAAIKLVASAEALVAVVVLVALTGEVVRTQVEAAMVVKTLEEVAMAVRTLEEVAMAAAFPTMAATHHTRTEVVRTAATPLSSISPKVLKPHSLAPPHPLATKSLLATSAMTSTRKA